MICINNIKLKIAIDTCITSENTGHPCKIKKHHIKTKKGFQFQILDGTKLRTMLQKLEQC